MTQSLTTDASSLGQIVCYMHEPDQKTVQYWVAVTYGTPLVVCTVIMAYFAYRLYERFNYLAKLQVSVYVCVCVYMCVL